MLSDQWGGHCRSLERATLDKDNDCRDERGGTQETFS